jgi:hypothetical protein
MLAANLGRLDCFHAWFWLRPLTIDIDGNVRWICYWCGHTIKAPVGTVPALGTE